MALKQLPHKPPAPLPAAPDWGVIATEGEAASVLRLDTGDASESLPYHTLTRWSLNPGTEETLTIHAGGATATICGWELEPVRDALDAGRLLSVVAVERRYVATKTGTVITNITIAPG